MAVEFIGTITTQPGSEIDPISGSVIDLDYLRTITAAHETAGFDGVLVPFSATLPDTFQVAQYAAASSERLGFVLAHRAGFVAPTVAARALATLDQVTGGRIALHMVTGGSDSQQRKDGDYRDKVSRYRRTAEYLEIIEALWTATGPIDHDGEFYRFEQAWSLLRPSRGRLPVYFGGASAQACRVGAAHSDVMVMWGEPLAGIREQIAAARLEAARFGRAAGKPRFALAVRPILAPTDAEAWERAEHILSLLAALPHRVVTQPSAGFQRLRSVADIADRHDHALWTAPAKLPGAKGNSTAIVGSPETVIAALLDYVRLGVSCFVINGYEPLRDVADYGRHIIPQVRDAAALLAD